MIPLSWYLIFAAALFSVGLFGALSRRNAVAILLGIELMLNAINVNLVAFWRYGDVMVLAFCRHRVCCRRGGSFRGPGFGYFRVSPSQYGGRG